MKRLIMSVMLLAMAVLVFASMPALAWNSEYLDPEWVNGMMAQYAMLPTEAWSVTLPATYEGHVYQIFRSFSMDYWASERFCEALGGHLACVTSEAEDSFLFKDCLSGSEASYAYFGLYYSGSEWEWMNGESVNYTRWAKGEPNGYENGNEFYACYSLGIYPNGDWNDAPCDDGTVFICEWDDDAFGLAEPMPEPTPEPTSTTSPEPSPDLTSEPTPVPKAETIVCPGCGHAFSGTEVLNFCPDCGTPLDGADTTPEPTPTPVPTCANCGHVFGDGAVPPFCPDCGTKQ